MKLLATLVNDLAFAKHENQKTDILIRYFESENDSASRDASLRLLIGHRPKKSLNLQKLKNWANEMCGYPVWLMERCEIEVGNFTKTLALLLPTESAETIDLPMPEWLEQIAALRGCSDDELQNFILGKLARTAPVERELLLKLMCGTFRSPVSFQNLVLAISHVLDNPIANCTLRLARIAALDQMGFNRLQMEIPYEKDLISLKIPELQVLDNLEDADLKGKKLIAYGFRDGLEAQLVKHGKRVEIWLSETEIVTDKFPKIVHYCTEIVGDFVLHGKIMPQNPEIPAQTLHARVGKKPSSGQDLEVIFLVDEVLRGDFTFQKNGASSYIYPEEQLAFSSHDELLALHSNCRELGFLGIHIRESGALSPRFLLKANAYNLNAVLMHIELDNMGIRNMSFGVWQEDELIPIAKIDNIDDALKTRELLDFVKANTIQKFGPVRSLLPSLVYQLHFDSIQAASRRKSGLALVNAAIDFKIGENAKEAGALESLKKLC